ncbi:MAG TPA: hypothetical protein VNZ05_04585 [Solirubrobacteraceae bacterium]|nr:hypothetical protein [Solirubrobacteraceae bacterium]
MKRRWAPVAMTAALLVGGCGSATKSVSCTQLAHETIFSERRRELLKEAERLGPKCTVKVPK